MTKTKLCKVCKKPFHLESDAFSAKANWKNRKYCSDECRQIVSNANPKKRKNEPVQRGHRKPAVFQDVLNKFIYGR